MQIKNALISVSDKTNLPELATALRKAGVQIYSTGGTAAALAKAGCEVTDIAALSGSGEILDGRVKTLHPKVHAGILADMQNPDHARQLADMEVPKMDLVVVNFYPFEKAVAGGASPQEVIENIDIGGPAMVRAAAKNHSSTVVLADPADYPRFIGSLQNGGIDDAMRRHFATKAFVKVAQLDAAIANHFSRAEEPSAHPPDQFLHMKKISDLKYGENPHQAAACYLLGDDTHNFTQLHGAPPSYNNLLDAYSAWLALCWHEQPAAVIVKHNNPCGMAAADTLEAAFMNAWRTDTVSAFGGVLGFNRPLDGDTAQRLQESFWEVVLAPQISDEAKSILAMKERLKIFISPTSPPPAHQLIGVGGLMLVQATDIVGATREERVVSKRQPTEQEWRDMRFAWRAAAAVKSNAIVLAREQATIGIGAGQMSRVDSARLACEKAKRAKLSTAGSAAASDGFFPFADGLKILASAKVSAVIQPGGSVNDEKVIAAADAAGMAMVLTGTRHFRH